MDLLPTAVILFSMSGLWTHATQWIPTIGGPFKVALRHYDSCPEEMRGLDLLTFTNRDYGCPWSKFERCVDTNITAQMDMTTEISGVMRIASWSNAGGWKENAHVINYPNVCQAMAVIFKDSAMKIFNQIMGEFHTCPFFKGVYRLREFGFLRTFPIAMVKHFIYGKWRVDGQAKRRNGQIVGCIRVFADTIPDMDAIKHNKGR